MSQRVVISNAMVSHLILLESICSQTFTPLNISAPERGSIKDSYTSASKHSLNRGLAFQLCVSVTGRE